MYIGTDSFFPRAKDELPPYSPLPLQVGPMNTARASGTALKAPPVGSGGKASVDKRFGAHWNQKVQL